MNIYILGVGVDVTNFYDNVLLYSKHRRWKTICTEDRIRQCEQMITINNGVKKNLVVFLKGDPPTHEVRLFERKISKLGIRFPDNFYVHRSDINSNIIKNILYSSYKIPKNQSLNFYQELEKDDHNNLYIDDMIKLFDSFNEYFKPFENSLAEEKNISDFDSQKMKITPVTIATIKNSMDLKASNIDEIDTESSGSYGDSDADADGDVASENIYNYGVLGMYPTFGSLGIISNLSAGYYVGGDNLTKKKSQKQKQKTNSNNSSYSCVCQ